MKKLIALSLAFVAAVYAFAETNEVGKTEFTPDKVAGYLERALKGDPKAEYLVGKAYLYGFGVEKKPEQAFCWASRAAEHGDVDGINLLGVCYEHGDGCVRNYSKAVELYKKSADLGSMKAKGNLGVMYAFGWGRNADEKKGTRDVNKAFPLLQECLASGLEHDPAMCAMVICCEEMGADRYETEIFKWSHKAADLENPWACRKLAECYLLGVGCEASEQECLKWLKASMKGFGICGVQLGMSREECEAFKSRQTPISGSGYFQPARQFRLFEKMSLSSDNFMSKAKVLWKVELCTGMVFRNASKEVQDKEEKMVLELFEKKFGGKFDTSERKDWATDNVIRRRHTMKCGDLITIEITRSLFHEEMHIYFESEFLLNYVRLLNRKLEEREQRKKDKCSGAVLDASAGADVL